jgi:indolepyruvate decarboxylase
MKDNIPVAEYLTLRLREVGVNHVFTITDYCAAFLDVLDATEGIERVPIVPEFSCAYEADGYALLKGIGAACVPVWRRNHVLLNCVAGSFVEFVPAAISSWRNATGRRQTPINGKNVHCLD